MKKRSMDEVFAAIGAAMAETRGRTLERIDHAGDAATSAARKRVSVTLQAYAPYADADPGDAEWRYRKELERALGGAAKVLDALRAFSLACESDPEDLSPAERSLAESWVAASQRARAEGMTGLADSHTAWFEVRSVRQPAPDSPPKPASPVKPSSPVRPPSPVQPDLF